MPPVPTRPRRLRWLRRALWGVVLLGVLLVALAWLAFENRTTLSLAVANHFLPAWRIDATKLEIGRSGGISLRDLRIQLRKDGSQVLSADKAALGFTWPGIRARNLQAVEIDGLRLAVNDAALDEASKLLQSSDPNAPGWTVDRITLRDGFAKLALATQPAVEGRLDVEMSGLATKPGSLRIRQAAVRSASGREIVMLPDTTLEFTPAELRDGRLRRLLIDRPRIALTQEETAFLKPATSSGSPAMRWRIGELSIHSADIQVDLPALPLISTTLDVKAADLDSAANDSGTPGQLRVANLSLRPRDKAAAPASLASATIDFTSGGIASGSIRQVRLERPSISLNEAWQSILAGLGSGTGPASGTDFPLNVERLLVEGGIADISLPGMPAIRGTIGAEFKDLGSSAAGVQTVELHDLHIGLPDQPAGVFREWLTLPKTKITFDIAELRDQHRLKTIELEGPSLNFDRETRAMFSKVGDGRPSPAKPIVAGEVRLHGATLSFDDLGLGIPPQKFTLNLNLTNVPLNDPLSAGTSEIQTLELANINFVSPLDPFVPVISLPSVFIRWTPAGLRARQIEEVKLVGPAIHIGPDLFWYMDMVDRQRAAQGVPAPGAGGPAWRVKQFEASAGKLVLAMTGQKRLTLPMPFESHAENLDFQQMSDMRLSLVLEVPEQDYDNETLDIHLGGVSGKIEFKLPPGSNAENVVHTLKVRDVRWRDFRGGDWWLGLTFDQTGIHGDGGGRMCAGDIRAGFTFFLDERTPWTGWLSGSRLDLKEITDKLSPGRASMTGRATVTLAVNGLGGDVTRVAGDFKVPRGGNLHVTKLDDLIAVIPADWENAKRDLMLIGLRTLRDFPYSKGTAAFWGTEQFGQLNVRLDGSLGSRELEVNFNPIGDLNRIFMFSPFKP